MLVAKHIYDPHCGAPAPATEAEKQAALAEWKNLMDSCQADEFYQVRPTVLYMHYLSLEPSAIFGKGTVMEDTLRGKEAELVRTEALVDNARPNFGRAYRVPEKYQPFLPFSFRVYVSADTVDPRVKPIFTATDRLHLLDMLPFTIKSSLPNIPPAVWSKWDRCISSLIGIGTDPRVLQSRLVALYMLLNPGSQEVACIPRIAGADASDLKRVGILNAQGEFPEHFEAIARVSLKLYYNLENHPEIQRKSPMDSTDLILAHTGEETEKRFKKAMAERPKKAAAREAQWAEAAERIKNTSFTPAWGAKASADYIRSPAPTSYPRERMRLAPRPNAEFD